MNQIIVQKYGGTSVGDPGKILNVARRIKERVTAGDKVVVVVSAMADTTDDLVSLARQITDSPSRREMDMLLSTGEQVSIALLAMALHTIDVEAISLTGAQVGIRTDSAFTKARIIDIRPHVLRKHLKKFKVLIVAGFQGVDKDLNITTLGRGGSDTTAVALAASLRADKCEIYTDVDGVYTTDPRVEPAARKIDLITYDDMLELASLGAKVMHSRSIEIAKRFGVVLEVRSSYNNNPGTIICKEFEDMEDQVVTGVTFKKDEAKMSIQDVPDKPGVAAKMFKILADRHININMIVQSSSRSGNNDISFTIDDAEVKEAKIVMEEVIRQVGGGEYYCDEGVGIVSIVGIGMRSHPGVAQKMFEVMGKNGINIQMISTSEIKISCVIDREKVDTAVKAIHREFELDRIRSKIKK